MNPLPDRPLLTNSSLPLSLPNVPSFEQMAYNGRPRKAMPETGKNFPLLNGTMNMMSGPSSAPAASGNQIPPLERSNPLGGGGLIQLQHQQQQHMQQMQHQGMGQGQQMQLHDQQDKDGDEPRQLTAIFRPDDRGEWKERLRLSHEAEQARQAGAAAWDRGDEDGKDEEGEVEEDESSVIGEGEGTKVWHPKRTLRKSVECFIRLDSFQYSLSLQSLGCRSCACVPPK